MGTPPSPWAAPSNPWPPFLWGNSSWKFQPEPPLGHLEAISSCPILCSLEVEPDPHLAAPNFTTSKAQIQYKEELRWAI